jgi:tRNA A37 N6-isopentenylltransferase MiaA
MVAVTVASRPARAADVGVDRSALLVICGPTGAGKTALIQSLAGATDLVVVNADSRQIYRGFDIGTAKPTPDERARVAHACLDLADPTERFTAYRWAAAAEAAIAAARRSGHTPIVVGGAGFYIRALVHPATEATPTGEDRHAARYLIVDPGAALRDRIAHRAESMLGGGWVEEVEQLARSVPLTAPAWQASGYQTVRHFVDGTVSRRDTLHQVVTATRQYAKRQRTWFRHQLPPDRVTWLDPDRAEAIGDAVTWLRRGAAVAHGSAR